LISGELPNGSLDYGINDIQSSAAPVATVAVRAGDGQTFVPSHVGDLTVIVNAVLHEHLMSVGAPANGMSHVFHLHSLAQNFLAVKYTTV